MRLEYSRSTHDENGQVVYRDGSEEAYEELNQATDGIIHAFDKEWMTLEEIIASWNRQLLQDTGRPFLESPMTVSQWLSALAAAGMVRVRAHHDCRIIESGSGVCQFLSQRQELNQLLATEMIWGLSDDGIERLYELSDALGLGVNSMDDIYEEIRKIEEGMRGG
jgi:DNA-binding transcriptional ArsR family regulator